MMCWTPTCLATVRWAVWDDEDPEVALMVCSTCAHNSVVFGGGGVRRRELGNG